MPTVVLDAPFEQPANDVVGLGKALVPLADAGPALANDVLVQPFAGAEPEDKAVLTQHCHRRRALQTRSQSGRWS